MFSLSHREDDSEIIRRKKACVSQSSSFAIPFFSRQPNIMGREKQMNEMDNENDLFLRIITHTQTYS